MQISGGRFAEWRDEKLRKLLGTGAVRVTKEHAVARVTESCLGCDFYGKVEPLPGMRMDGCKRCGCPSATKPHFLTIERAFDKQGEPLSLEELFRLKTNSTIETVTEKIKCPHPDGNKWAKIDKTFLKTDIE